MYRSYTYSHVFLSGIPNMQHVAAYFEPEIIMVWSGGIWKRKYTLKQHASSIQMVAQSSMDHSIQATGLLQAQNSKLLTCGMLSPRMQCNIANETVFFQVTLTIVAMLTDNDDML